MEQKFRYTMYICIFHIRKSNNLFYEQYFVSIKYLKLFYQNYKTSNLIDHSKLKNLQTEPTDLKNICCVNIEQWLTFEIQFKPVFAYFKAYQIDCYALKYANISLNWISSIKLLKIPIIVYPKATYSLYTVLEYIKHDKLTNLQ